MALWILDLSVNSEQRTEACQLIFFDGNYRLVIATLVLLLKKQLRVLLNFQIDNVLELDQVVYKQLPRWPHQIAASTSSHIIVG